ncbi:MULTISPECIES: phage neck terminator protein [Cronobacter]|uniref:phage neck terminator protein n=1 Tax=Cronobacter TaxID=413496 RepID=UPI0021020723|nr:MULTISPECIES: hypothetical protein [Cronobacter]MDK1185171.1 hypothetical protein [Cronobacter turicensis]MDK1195302.1 hypothetical protein [Cronobacter dublinensis]MDK1200445.1 hypothetical protein [Cronobacter dublinensis]MDK1207725.1 hypothetical protein [Cronobacter turicensis]MDK1216025.1 hypothetical protein [Cronobacter turicensis]
MNDFTIDNIIDVLADYLEPVAGTCTRAQANRVPMPKGKFCVLTPLRLSRLSTTREVPGDTGDASTSTMGYTEVRQVDIQVDIYGDNAGDRAVAVETTFASDYAWNKIKSLDARLAPLYSSPAIQAPMINAEEQWEERYVLTLSLQAHITISLPQDYFDKAEISTEMVDN